MKAMDENEVKRYVKAIKIIHRYELSIPMMDSERLLRIENGEYKLNKEITPKLLEDAQKCVSYLYFSQQLDTLRFTGDGNNTLKSDERPIRCDLKLGVTPDIYAKMGMERLPLLYTRRHAIKALVPKATNREAFQHNHGLTKKIMRQIPQLLEDPVLVYNSPGHPNRLCVVLNQVDRDRYPIVAILEPNSKKGVVNGARVPKSNFLVSVYGKGNLTAQLAHKVPAHEVIYFNKEKSRGIERISGIQFPRDYSCLDSRSIIQIPRCIGNKEHAGRSARISITSPDRDVMDLHAKKAEASDMSKAIGTDGRGDVGKASRDER